MLDRLAGMPRSQRQLIATRTLTWTVDGAVDAFAAKELQLKQGAPGGWRRIVAPVVWFTLSWLGAWACGASPLDAVRIAALPAVAFTGFVVLLHIGGTMASVLRLALMADTGKAIRELQAALALED
jgi:hypothetical protein